MLGDLASGGGYSHPFVSCPAIMPSLAQNLSTVQKRATAACLAANRPSNAARLLSVTKSVDARTTTELAHLLHNRGPQPVVLAENRVPALMNKVAECKDLGAPPIEWHFIGHLQRNKARRVVRLCHALHAVDSLRLLEAIERLAGEEQTRVEVFLQVALTGEAEKDGMDEAELLRCFAAARGMRNLDLAGLMAMGPRPESKADVRHVFARAGALAHALEAEDRDAFVRGRCELSLGMSGDLEEAVTAGSHWLRIGGALFTDLPSAAPVQDPTRGTTRP